MPPLGLLVPLVLLVVVITVIKPVFLQGRNVFWQITISLILGTGMTIVMAARCIGMSVGAMVALSGCVAGLLRKSGMFGDGLASALALVVAISVTAECRRSS